MHRDVASWLQAPSSHQLRARALNELLDLAVRGRTRRVKSVSGTNRGWLRSPLGGASGSHFYLWWRTRPGEAGGTVSKPSLIVRAIRHHDETDRVLEVGDPDSDYVAWAPSVETSGESLTEAQERVLTTRVPVVFVRGAPGTGKTRALLELLARDPARHALYVTKNHRLAEQAARFVSTVTGSSERIAFWTADGLIDTLAQIPTPRESERVLLAEFSRVVARLPRALGRLRSTPHRLYAEIHAHVLGRSLPLEFRGRPPAKGRLLDPNAYLKVREPVLGAMLARGAVSVATHLGSMGLLDRFFPSPTRAWQAALNLAGRAAAQGPELKVTSLLVDEIQDLTPLETLVLLSFCTQSGPRDPDSPVRIVVAGDEGQTVKPSDFDWGELADLAGAIVGRPVWLDLEDDLRGSQAVSQVVERSWGLYRHLEKSHRPRGKSAATLTGRTAGDAVLVSCASEPEMSAVMAALSELADSVLVYPGEEVPERLEALAGGPESILTCRDVKGLDFQTVTVLHAAAHLDSYCSEVLDPLRDTASSMLTVRMMADQLRVALSRATERLVLLELGPSSESVRQLRDLVGSSVRQLPAGLFIDELTSERTSPEELAAEMCEELEKLLETHPHRCYRRAAWMLERLHEPSGLPSGRELLRLAGLAAVLSAQALTPGLSSQESELRLRRARAWLDLSGARREAELVGLMSGDAPPADEPDSSHPEVHPLLRVRFEAWRVRSQGAGGSSVAGLQDGARGPGREPRPSFGPDWELWEAEFNTGEVLLEDGEMRQAERHFRRVVALARELEPRDGRVVLSLGRLGAAQLGRGLFALASDTLRKAVELHRAAGDPDSVDLALILQLLARASLSYGRLEEAERAARRALGIQARFLRPGHEDWVQSMLCLSRVVQRRGEVMKALKLLDEILDSLDPEDLDLEASVLRKRAELCEFVGRPAEAARDRERLDALGAALPRELLLRRLEELSTAELIAKVGSKRTLESDDACVILVRRGGAVVAAVVEEMCFRIRSRPRPCESHASGESLDEERLADSALLDAGTQAFGLVLAQLAHHALPVVRDAAQDSDEAVRLEMVRTLGAIAMTVPEATSELLHALRDSSAKVRCMAILRLGMLAGSGPEVVAALKMFATSAEEEERINAILALASLGEELAFVLPIVEQYLQEPSVALRFYALTAVEKAGHAARSLLAPVMQNLRHEMPLVRRCALTALAALLETASEREDYVRPLEDDPDPAVRQMVQLILNLPLPS
ncbi:MAG: HEAT repeat domain-containing protein [Candidatus Riflebacteria bacterium]|nr:HEAT repeat domain-containing protein [Candidatus Riflebacteria bacterium]